jgi:hypothetical protein
MGRGGDREKTTVSSVYLSDGFNEPVPESEPVPGFFHNRSFFEKFN